MLVLATFTSQLFGALAFALAAVWLVVLGDHSPLTIGTLALGAVCAFAGGMAYRGSVNALGLCAVLDVAMGIALITKPFAVKAFVLVPTMWVRPELVREAALGMTLLGLVALATAAACIAAVPQVRRFVAWRTGRFTAVA